MLKKLTMLQTFSNDIYQLHVYAHINTILITLGNNQLYRNKCHKIQCVFTVQYQKSYRQSHYFHPKLHLR